MFLSAYHFDGDPAALAGCYDRLLAGFPPGSIELQVCVVTDLGLSVFDACPSRQVFEQFSASSEFGSALAATGLPVPRIEPLGEAVSR